MALALATEAVEPEKKAGTGQWTKSALEARAARQKKHQLLLAEAVAWCNEHSKGGKLAMKKERFASTDLTARKINYALTNPIVQRNKYDVLTSVELTRLKEWIRSAEAVTDQARQLLRPRARRRTRSPLHDARRRCSTCRSHQRPCLTEGSKNHAPWRPFRHSACGTRKKFAAGRVRRAPRCCHIRPGRLPRVSQTSLGCCLEARA